MKLTAAVAALAAGATMASASPLRVIVVSNALQKPDSDPFNIAHMRFGHPASHTNNPNANVAQLLAPGAAPVAQHGKGPCMGALFKQKALEAQNAFRKAFGLPLIEHDHHQGHPGFHHGGVIQVVPYKGNSNGGATFVSVKGSDASGWWGTTKGGERVHIETQGESIPAFRVGIPARRPRPHHHHAHPHMVHHAHGGPSFMVRLEDALMALGPWEGRAVAFVIGAGIGVLIRMLWVFGVLILRGCSNDGREYESVPEDDDDEDDVRRTPMTAPPTYIYPIDEKVGFEHVDAPKAQPGN